MRNYQEAERGNTALGLMINGEYVFTGKTVQPQKSRLQIIIRRKRMNSILDVTPGEILREEVLKPMNISAYRLAKDTNMPAARISEILKGRRRITADTALRLSKYFGN